MSSVYKLEALATKAVLTKYSSLESFPDRGRRLVNDLFSYSGRYKLSSRLDAVFDYEGNKGNYL